ncbi:DEAD/DEAH box helicase family protein [uncultured Phascolarctobacterium sp.]|uniref:DEAD/DEAH box helicase family protein n=1 Tax=uncultured Phascolarctobacterium sp. TaxID=512296 RepID=UPI0015B11859|nr:DEAD/DEAH box helicase family protein [uncultured Phascolarctobacterium sp.]
MANINGNEASVVDIKVIKQLEQLGFVLNDTLLYQHSYSIPEHLQSEIGKKFITPDITLVDAYSKEVIAIIENKLSNEKKALGQLLIGRQVLKPRFLYAVSEDRMLFLDTTWQGLDDEYKPVKEFLSYDEMRDKINQEKVKRSNKPIKIDTTIAGGYDSNINKERYYQLDCINTLIEKYKSGKQKMLVHMATGLGKTRTMVAFTKAMLDSSLCKRVLFVVDRRLLAKQALEEGFALISPRYYNADWIKTSNFKLKTNIPIHIVVIDTLEILFSKIPNNFYDLIIVDECHRSISVNRKLVLDHFHCPKIGLTATPRIAVGKKGKDVAPEDLEIADTYKLFGCETQEPDYQFDLERGIDEGFLAPYDVLEIKTHLTKEAEDEGILFEYVLDPDTRERIELPKEQKIKLEQLEKKYLSEERCDRIAEEIKKNTQFGEKIILFCASQIHCIMMAKAINKLFNDGSDNGLKYAHTVISNSSESNEFIKNQFKKPFQKPYVVTSVDIMSTGVDIPCVRYIGFAALTDSVGKYIQMVGRGARLDTKESGKYSFRILDFVGLCSRMDDDGKGTKKLNETTVVGGTTTTVGGGGKTEGEYFIIDNVDPSQMIERVFIHGDDYKVVDNIPIDKAKKIFEKQVNETTDEVITSIKEKVTKKSDYQPTEQEVEYMDEWVKKPDIYLDEDQLQKIYDYPQGSIWDFLLQAFGVRKIPTIKDRISQGYDTYVSTYNFNELQKKQLNKFKKIFIANAENRTGFSPDSIFSNRVYEKKVGTRKENDDIFNGNFDVVFNDIKHSLNLPSEWQ